MRISRKSIVLSVVTLLLGMYVVYILTQYVFRKEVGPIPDISALLPSELPGWSVTDLPVGETEEVRQKMDEILDYDSAIYREYQKGLVRIQVYISYWSEGKAHFRAVYGHTPDVCWVRGGWKSIVQDPDFHFRLETDPPLKLKTGQYREFVIGKEHLRVVFWQLLKGEPFTYGNFSYPPATAIFTDIFTRGFNQKPEQWFVRVAVNVDFDHLLLDPGFQELMWSMTRFGLEAENVPNT